MAQVPEPKSLPQSLATVSEPKKTGSGKIRHGLSRHVRSMVGGLGFLVLTIGILAVIANLFLAASYLIAMYEQKTLIAEIEGTREAMSHYIGPATVQKLLLEAEAGLAAEREAFPTLTSSAGIADQLVSRARSHGLTVIEAETGPGKDIEVGQHNYRGISVTLQVTGTLSALLVFLQEIEDGVLSGARVAEVDISEIGYPDSGSIGGELQEQELHNSDQMLVASVAFLVYERQGSLD